MKATLLATPTAELVRIRCDEFDRDPSTHLAEDALGQLWVQFPRNTETAHVLLKVLALNKLNSTQVRDIDVEILARHIAGIGIDPLLAEGSPVPSISSPIASTCGTTSLLPASTVVGTTPTLTQFTTVVLMNVSGHIKSETGLQKRSSSARTFGVTPGLA